MFPDPDTIGDAFHEFAITGPNKRAPRRPRAHPTTATGPAAFVTVLNVPPSQDKVTDLSSAGQHIPQTQPIRTSSGLGYVRV